MGDRTRVTITVWKASSGKHLITLFERFSEEIGSYPDWDYIGAIEVPATQSGYRSSIWDPEKYPSQMGRAVRAEASGSGPVYVAEGVALVAEETNAGRFDDIIRIVAEVDPGAVVECIEDGWSGECPDEELIIAPGLNAPYWSSALLFGETALTQSELERLMGEASTYDEFAALVRDRVGKGFTDAIHEATLALKRDLAWVTAQHHYDAELSARRHVLAYIGTVRLASELAA